MFVKYLYWIIGDLEIEASQCMFRPPILICDHDLVSLSLPRWSCLMLKLESKISLCYSLFRRKAFEHSPVSMPVFRWAGWLSVTEHVYNVYTSTEYTSTEYTCTEYTCTEYTSTEYTCTECMQCTCYLTAVYISIDRFIKKKWNRHQISEGPVFTSAALVKI